MQEYPDQKQHIERYIEASAQRVASAIQETGLRPTPTLIRVIAEKTVDDAKARYLEECAEVHASNIAHILSDHKRRMNEIKREGLRMAWIICIPVALVFLAIAIADFTQGQTVLACMFIFGALAFLSMLVHAIVTRPKEHDHGLSGDHKVRHPACKRYERRGETNEQSRVEH